MLTWVRVRVRVRVRVKVRVRVRVKVRKYRAHLRDERLQILVRLIEDHRPERVAGELVEG